jgi:hypothetical protein
VPAFAVITEAMEDVIVILFNVIHFVNGINKNVFNINCLVVNITVSNHKTIHLCQFFEQKLMKR